VIRAAALLLALQGPADAPQAFPDPSGTVSGVVVHAGRVCLPPQAPPAPNGRRPVVVSTFPRTDQTVRPGVLVIRVTFDQAMACGASVSVDNDLPNPCELGQGSVLLLSKRTTFKILCHVEGGRRYGIRFNRPPNYGFVGLNGFAAEGRELTFNVSNAAPVPDAEAAVQEDPQGRQDFDPVQR
jgi:hypothetical protein